MPPLAPSTWIGTSRPVLACRSSRAAAISLTGSYRPVYVTPMITTTPMVFSSTKGSIASAVRPGFSLVTGT